MNEEYDKFKIDIKETLLRNLLWIPMFLLVCSFCIMGLNRVVLFDDEILKTMVLIFTLFFTLKLIVWCGQPTLVLKETKK